MPAAKRYHVVFPFLGQEVGGSHIATFRLGQALKQYFGFECLVLCGEGSAIAAEAARYGLDVGFTGESSVGRNNPFYDLTKLAHRIALLKRCGDSSTIVHANDLASVQSWGPCAKAVGMKLVYQHHSLDRASLPNRMTLSLPDAFIAVSDACVRDLRAMGQRRATKIVNPCFNAQIDRAAARAAVAREAGVSANSTLVGFIANFWARKRPHFFIDVARSIATADPRAHFLMFGSGRDYSEQTLKAYAVDQGLGESIDFMGFRSPPEENVAALDVLLAPAVEEPFGLTPVEAMLAGTPYVITADASHLESFARWGGGLSVPKNASPQQFADAALLIIQDKVRPALTEAERARIAAELSPRTQAEAVTEVYRGFTAFARKSS